MRGLTLFAGILALALCGDAALAKESSMATAKVAKIYVSDDTEAFFNAKYSGVYCYIEEDPKRSAQMAYDVIKAGNPVDRNAVLALAETKCFDAFRAEAAKKQYNDEEIDAQIYRTGLAYADFEVVFARYIASCMWEANPRYFRAELAGVADYNGIPDYLKTGHTTGEFDEIGTACMFGYVDLDEADRGFTYRIVQQLLIRRGLD